MIGVSSVGVTRIPSPTFVVVPCGNAKVFSDWPEAVDIPATGFDGNAPRCVFERYTQSYFLTTFPFI